MTGIIPTPQVSLVNGRPAVTSLDVAQHFGKQHKNVLRDIRRLMDEMPNDLRGLNFELTFKSVAGPNNSQRQEEYFTIFQDGFMLLVMGYTGKEAMRIKIAYIVRFNEMAEALNGRNRNKPLPASGPVFGLSRISAPTDPERKELAALINAWVGCSPIHYAGARNIVNAHIGVKGVNDMTVEQVKRACEFVQARINDQAAQAQLTTSKPPCALPDTTAAWEAELNILHDEALGLHMEVTRRLRTLSTRLSRIAGPLYQRVTAKLMEGTPCVSPDCGITTLHASRYEAFEMIESGMHHLAGSISQARWFARTSHSQASER